MSTWWGLFPFYLEAAGILLYCLTLSDDATKSAVWERQAKVRHWELVAVSLLWPVTSLWLAIAYSVHWSGRSKR